MLLVLLGVWGGLIPFVGPYFNYAYAPDNTWDYTNGRLILEIVPAVAAILGGLLTLGSSSRPAGMFGGWLAALGGAWFVVGMPLSAIWSGPTVGSPLGGTTRQAVEYVGFFGGLGAVIVFLAAFALGRFAVVGVREARRAAEPMAMDERTTGRTEPAAARPTGTTDETGTEPLGEEETSRHRGLHWHGSRHVGAH